MLFKLFPLLGQKLFEIYDLFYAKYFSKTVLDECKKTYPFQNITFKAQILSKYLMKPALIDDFNFSDIDPTNTYLVKSRNIKILSHLIAFSNFYDLSKEKMDAVGSLCIIEILIVIKQMKSITKLNLLLSYNTLINNLNLQMTNFSLKRYMRNTVRGDENLNFDYHPYT